MFYKHQKLNFLPKNIANNRCNLFKIGTIKLLFLHPYK